MHNALLPKLSVSAFLILAPAHIQAQGVVDELLQKKIVQNQNDLKQNDLNQKVDNLTALIRNLYYADECGVFETKGDGYFIWYPTYYMLLTKERAFAVPRFGERVERAKKLGIADARSIGCNFWREHQQAIADLRAQAKTARSANLGWMSGRP